MIGRAPRPVAYVGQLLAGDTVDGRAVDFYIPGKWISGILFDHFCPDMMAEAANA